MVDDSPARGRIEPPAAPSARGTITSLLTLLAVPGWLYLWLGSETSPSRVLVFLAGYLMLGVAVTNRRHVDPPHEPTTVGPPLRSGGPPR